MERLGREALGLLLDRPPGRRLPVLRDEDEARSLLRMAERNVVLLRLDERLRGLGVAMPPAPWATAVAAERVRIQATLQLIRRLSEACEAAAVEFVFHKAFQHFPDMGHDVDLLVLDRSGRVDAILRNQLGAARGADSVVHRLAHKRAWVVPGAPSPLEVHHGRLGLLGEHAAYPVLLVRRREPLEVEGVRTWIPTPEDQLLVQAVQRIYTHGSLRLSDVLHTVETLRRPGFDWDYVVSTARMTGVVEGLACYLHYVRDAYGRSGDTPLAAPAIRPLAAPRWAGHARFVDHAYRFPVAGVLGRVYAAKVLDDVRRRNWRSVGKLSLLPPLAVLVGVRDALRRVGAARAQPRPAPDGPGGGVKRALDIAASVLGLATLAPVFLVVGALIKLEDGGPVLYRSARAGLGGRPFGMLKFRTMVVGADRIGPPSTAADDPRITRVGRLLRRYKVDEIPQLINVLRGEMSLVGPRPEVLSEVEQYAGEERLLLSVLPGMTDWASLRFRDEGEILRGSRDPHQTYRERIRPEKIRLGLEYVRRRSLGVDVKILMLTLLTVFGVAPRLTAETGKPVGGASERWNVETKR